MFSTRIMSYAVFAWLTAVSLTASGQTEKFESPTIETAPTVQYQSVFSDYKGFQDPELVSWRKANEQVADTSGQGGHTMSDMSSQSKGSAMASMPGHDMGKMKEELKAAKPVAGETRKNNQAMGDTPSMKGMDHSSMKGMDHSNMKNEKDKQ